MNRTLALALLSSLALVLSLPAAAARAGSPSDFRLSDLPLSFSYQGSQTAGFRSAQGVRYRHERQQLRLLEAPTRYRTKSILRYSKQLGSEGPVLRIKAPLKPRQMVKIELRF